MRWKWRLALHSTLLENWSLLLGQEGIDPDPDQREDGSKQNGPEHDDGGSSVLPTRRPLQERIQMNDDPEGKEELPEQRPPGAVAVVDGVGWMSIKRKTMNHSIGCQMDTDQIDENYKRYGFEFFCILIN